MQSWVDRFSVLRSDCECSRIKIVFAFYDFLLGGSSCNFTVISQLRQIIESNLEFILKSGVMIDKYIWRSFLTDKAIVSRNPYRIKTIRALQIGYSGILLERMLGVVFRIISLNNLDLKAECPCLLERKICNTRLSVKPCSLKAHEDFCKRQKHIGFTYPKRKSRTDWRNLYSCMKDKHAPTPDPAYGIIPPRTIKKDRVSVKSNDEDEEMIMEWECE